jgi:hypothetical protein
VIKVYAIWDKHGGVVNRDSAAQSMTSMIVIQRGDHARIITGASRFGFVRGTRTS